MELVAGRVKELLKKMGFSEYEANAYTILAFSGPLTAVEVAEFTKIPRPRIYDIIQGLEEKGIVIREEGKPTKYNAVPAAELTRLLDEEENKRLAAVKSTCGELLGLLGPSYEKVAPSDGVSYALKGTDALKQKLLEMIENTQKADIITSSAYSFLMKQPELFLKYKKSTKDVRIITDRMTRNIDVAKIKTHSVSDKFGMLVTDDECLFVTVEGESHEYNVGCYIRDSRMCKGFETAFEVLWNMI